MFLITATAWIVVPLFGALPFLLLPQGTRERCIAM
jgi:hypothetical protein